MVAAAKSPGAACWGLVLTSLVLFLGGCGADRAETTSTPPHGDAVVKDVEPSGEDSPPSEETAFEEPLAAGQDVRDLPHAEPLGLDPPPEASLPWSREPRAALSFSPEGGVPSKFKPLAEGLSTPDIALRMSDDGWMSELAPRSAAEEPLRSELPVDDSPPEASASAAATDPQQPYELVTVFYATDRRAIERDSTPVVISRWIMPVIVGVSFTVVWIVLGLSGFHRRLSLSLAAVSLAATLVWGLQWSHRHREDSRPAAQSEVSYGNERGELQLGTCDVTIPWTHRVGEIERPSILRLEVREDARKHIVVQRIERQGEERFYQQLRERLEAAPRREVFVFVHGYNVTFEGAARRTAQIAYDVKFAGAPIFFSWPSQGGLLKYAVDENNAQWTVPHLKQFLLDVVQRSGAESVNLIAHSMGNRALTVALRELHLQLAGESALFNQIILAAPDVDAEIFRRDLAPALIQSARHVTLYASSNDQALIASRKVHGYARAGDSGTGLVVLPGIETIDVSLLDTSFLGHSYYGSSYPILDDIGLLIHQALPAARRRWLVPRPYGELTYWVFEKISETATRGLPR
jgi:esterase/lipase superfamily enzyme